MIKTALTASYCIHLKFLPSHSPDLFLFPRFHLSRFQSWPILFQPLSLKFANSSLLLKVNNVSLIPSQLSFWNSASLNSIQPSQTLPVSFWVNFPIVIQTSFCPASSQKTISIHWWSQQLSFNFKHQLHFQHSWESCMLLFAFNPTCRLSILCVFF